MSAIAVIGTGYVGLTSAACFAELGHQVTGVDIDEAKVATLKQGRPTIYEPGLEEIMARGLHAGRLRFTHNYEEAIPGADFVFLAVGTPMGRRGEADLVFIKQAAKSIAGAMRKTLTIVNESARICERVDADVKVVSEGMGMDRRIGPLFLDAGIGYGGSCFPKDVKALARMAETLGYHPELLDAVMEINLDQRTMVVDKLREVLGGIRDHEIGILGLAYKPNTDDVRRSEEHTSE